MITLIISFHVKEECKEDFREFLKKLKTTLPQQTGCHSIEVYSDSSSERRFTLVEAWTSKEVHQSYFEKLVASGDWDRIKSQQSEDPVAGYFTAV